MIYQSNLKSVTLIWRKRGLKKILSQNVCIDERFLDFKDDISVKQYIANKKAHRWGSEGVDIIAESHSGYTHHVQIYQGKHNSPNHPQSQGYKVVMDFTRPHFDNLHHVTIDSWFTCPKLLHDLRNPGIFFFLQCNCHYYAEGNDI